MPRNGSGTMTVPTGSDAVANETASSSAFNALLRDLETVITDSINKDGTKAWAAAQSHGNFKITSLGEGTARSDGTAISQLQDGKINWVAAGGSADAITATYSPAITALVDGQICAVRAGAANATTTPTFAPNGLTARTIVKGNAAALAVGDIVGANHEILLRYDLTNTRWCLLNPYPAAAAGATPADTTNAGIVELATNTEVLTGTAATNIAVTPDALAALWEQGSNIASAATVSVGEGGHFRITGTTTITDIDPATDKAGRRFSFIFADALTLTYNGTTLILPTSADITTAAGDVAVFVSEGTDAVRCISYMRRDGTPLVSASVATQAEMETASATDKMVTPGRVHFHPGVAKFWAYVTVSGGTPTLATSRNVTSITDNGTGLLTITIATDFSNANWCCIATVELEDTSIDSNSDSRNVAHAAKAAGTVQVQCWDDTGPISYADPASWNVVGFGDHA